VFLVEKDAHAAPLPLPLNERWKLLQLKGGVPVVASGLGTLDQPQTQALEPHPQLQVFPAIEVKPLVEGAGGGFADLL
jgi:hypothetical protein